MRLFIHLNSSALVDMKRSLHCRQASPSMLCQTESQVAQNANK
uniref:Uncharacterized protein n=1 Tax=Anguilla anguilla TaxID=7936 RepID=A0A0E9RXA4_ANGAN